MTVARVYLESRLYYKMLAAESPYIGLSASATEEELSLHELKCQLRESFLASGVLADVTARLRRQFVADLARGRIASPTVWTTAGQRGVGGGNKPVGMSKALNLSLSEKLRRALVVDFLKAKGLMQSLAVFLPESGLGAEGGSVAALPSRIDILQGLSIGPQSELAKRLIARAAESDPLPTPPDGSVSTVDSREGSPLSTAIRLVGAGTLIGAMASELSHRSNMVVLEAGCQTDSSGPGHKEALDKHMKDAEDRWREKQAQERLNPARGIEERMLAYQKEVDARAEIEIKDRVQRLRDGEIAAIKAQEAAARRREVDIMRCELNAEHTMRLERIKADARAQETRLAEKVRAAEAAQFDARQKLASELDCLKAEKQQMTASFERRERSLGFEETRLKDRAAAVDARAEECAKKERDTRRREDELVEATRTATLRVVSMKEQTIAQEREALEQERSLLRKEREACQKQLGAAAEASAQAQTLRSELLACELKLKDAMGDLTRTTEQLQVYKEAYEIGREVHFTAGGVPFTTITREELESKLQSANAALDDTRQRYKSALRAHQKATATTNTEMMNLTEKLHAAEGASEIANSQMDEALVSLRSAEARADSEAVARAGAEAEVSSLQQLLQRSRETIEALRVINEPVPAPLPQAVQSQTMLSSSLPSLPHWSAAPPAWALGRTARKDTSRRRQRRHYTYNDSYTSETGEDLHSYNSGGSESDVESGSRVSQDGDRRVHKRRLHGGRDHRRHRRKHNAENSEDNYSDQDKDVTKGKDRGKGRRKSRADTASIVAAQVAAAELQALEAAAKRRKELAEEEERAKVAREEEAERERLRRDREELETARRRLREEESRMEMDRQREQREKAQQQRDEKERQQREERERLEVAAASAAAATLALQQERLKLQREEEERSAAAAETRRREAAALAAQQSEELLREREKRHQMQVAAAEAEAERNRQLVLIAERDKKAAMEAVAAALEREREATALRRHQDILDAEREAERRRVERTLELERADRERIAIQESEREKLRMASAVVPVSTPVIGLVDRSVTSTIVQEHAEGYATSQTVIDVSSATVMTQQQTQNVLENSRKEQEEQEQLRMKEEEIARENARIEAEDAASRNAVDTEVAEFRDKIRERRRATTGGTSTAGHASHSRRGSLSSVDDALELDSTRGDVSDDSHMLLVPIKNVDSESSRSDKQHHSGDGGSDRSGSVEGDDQSHNLSAASDDWF